jgi:hypothetical protein
VLYDCANAPATSIVAAAPARVLFRKVVKHALWRRVILNRKAETHVKNAAPQKFCGAAFLFSVSRQLS